MTSRSGQLPLPLYILALLLLLHLLLFSIIPLSTSNDLPSTPAGKLLNHTPNSSSTPLGPSRSSPRRKKGVYLTVCIAAPVVVLFLFMAICTCFRAKSWLSSDPEQQKQQKQASPDEIHSKPKKIDRPHIAIGLASPPFDASRRPFRPASPGRFSPSTRTSSMASVQPQITLSLIAKATQGFSQSCVIGKGFYGMVYKGELPDGQIVAVKRAEERDNAAPRNGFTNEINLLSQIEHKNLVKLLGYIDEGNEQIIVSEYVQNGTLRGHLDGHGKRFLDFSQRLNIAIDVAHGLTYLHQYADKKIIHRDVKSSNILLTEAMSAKVADFGFARVNPADQSHVVTKIRGTAGYVDPHYMVTGVLSTKSDVFSYGVLLLEILSGRHPLELARRKEEKVTVRWAFTEYTKGKMKKILDPNIEEQVPEEVTSKLLGLAFDCAAPVARDRPPMEEVVKILWNIRNQYVKSRSG